jgi:chemotaxis-related protein WspD
MIKGLPSSVLGTRNSGKLNDCWNQIGVWGNRECGELKKAIHCRNCIVYSSAAAQLLGADLPLGYLDGWTNYFATEPKVEDRQERTALIIRIGAERMALSPSYLQEIADGRPIHSVPQRRSDFLLGLANIRGELLICVALDRLLGLEKKAIEQPGSKRVIYSRLVVAGRGNSRFVFPVDEVHGIHRFNPKDLTEVPSTVSKTQKTYLTGILLWQSKSVGCIDDQLLFDRLDRNLT